MSLESILSRKLDIRFLDAKRLINEAKVNLSISGYVKQEDKPLVHAEALRVFQKLEISQQEGMRKANWDLESVKSSTGSQSSSGWLDAGSVVELSLSQHSNASTMSSCSTDSQSSVLKSTRSTRSRSRR